MNKQIEIGTEEWKDSVINRLSNLTTTLLSYGKDVKANQVNKLSYELEEYFKKINDERKN